MIDLPENFEPCKFEVTVRQTGSLGTIIGCLFQYPCWIGILDPALTLDALQELVDKIEYTDLEAQIRDMSSGKSWFAKISDLVLPTSSHPWYEVKWYDDSR